MASADYDYLATRQQVIERAFRIIGALPLGQPLSAAKAAQGLQAFQSMIKLWQVDAGFVWVLREKEVILTNGTESYPMGNDPSILGVDSAHWVNGTTLQHLKLITWREFHDLPDRMSTGDPVVCALNRQQPAYLYVNPIPNRTLSLQLLVAEVVHDLDSASNLGQFMQHWEDALTYGLADNLSDEYPLSVSEKDRISRKAGAFYKTARAFKPDEPEEDFVRPI